MTITMEALPVVPAALGEAPVWDPATNTLLWVDIPGGRLHRTNPETGVTGSIEVGPYPSFIYPAGPGRVLMAHCWALELVDEPTGSRQVLMRLDGDENTRLNDAKIDDAGRLVIGAMVYPWKQGGPCNLYRLDLVRQTTEVLATGIRLSNGLDWNRERSLMYFVDTPTRQIDVFDVADDGSLTGRRAFVRFEEGIGNPDGLTLDASGNVWVAMFDGGAIRQYTPEGRVLRHISIPVPHVTSLCFGGEDYRDIFVTTASNRLTEEDRHLYPDAGKIFRIRGAGQGHPTPLVGLPGGPS